jgi:sugar lactone lactonase YvrE
VVAGDGAQGFGGDGGPARDVRLGCPDAIDIDARGNIFVADRCNERIRRIDATTGSIDTVAGNGSRGPGSDGPARAVPLTGVFYLRVVDDRTILFTDTDAHRIRELDLTAGRVRTVAGSGTEGFSGDGGPALRASFRRPHVAVRLRDGSLVIGDSFNHRIRRVSAGGVVETMAGNGEEGAAVDGARAAESPLLYFGEIHELEDGDLIWSEWGSSQLVRLDRDTGRLSVVAGSTAFGRAGPDGPARGAALGSIVDFAFDAEGRIVAAVASEGLIRRIDLRANRVDTLVGR